MSNFRRFAFLTAIATYLLIFIGGLVRVSGAGLGCPDWPKCFGRWIPPLSINQLPADIDPASFNITLAWIEYFNRLMGMTVGILILITAVLAIKYFRKSPVIMYTSIFAAFLVAFQGWQGGQVVASELEPIIISVHMILALIIVSMLIFVAQQAYYLEKPSEESGVEYPAKIGRDIGILWVAVILQILAGTQVRSQIEIIGARYPLLSDKLVLGMIGWVNYLHIILGVMVIGYTFHIVYKLLGKGRSLPVWIRQAITGMAILMGGQLIIGLILILVGTPELMRVLHLWVASIFLGLLLLLFSAVRHSKGGVDAA